MWVIHRIKTPRHETHKCSFCSVSHCIDHNLDLGKKVHFKGLLVAQISIFFTPKPAPVLLTPESLLVCTARDNLLFCAAQHPRAGLNQALQIPQHHPPLPAPGNGRNPWGIFVVVKEFLFLFFLFSIKINFSTNTMVSSRIKLWFNKLSGWERRPRNPHVLPRIGISDCTAPSPSHPKRTSGLRGFITKYQTRMPKGSRDFPRNAKKIHIIVSGQPGNKECN